MPSRRAFLLAFPAALAAKTVREHGAAGDGEADDTAALQRAADDGGALRLSAGRYRIRKTITVDLDRVGPSSILGDGAATVVMDGPGPAFRIVGTHGGTASPATVKENVWLRQRTPLLDGFEIVGGHAEADGIRIEGVMQPTLTRLTIRRTRNAIHLTGRNRNVIVDACHLYDNLGAGVLMEKLNLHQVNITDSHISYNAGGGVVIRESEIRNLQIGSCDIEGNMAPAGAPTANVWIDVRKGSVREGAIIGCTLQHNHNSPESANIRMIGAPEAPLHAGYFSIADNALSDVRVNVWLSYVRGVSILGNSFWKGFDHDLLVEGSSNIVLGPNLFDRNPEYRPGDSKNGVVFRDSRDSTIQGVHINGSLAEPAALELRRCRRFNVTGASVLDSAGAGILLVDCEDTRVSDCSVFAENRDDDYVAIEVRGGRNVQVRDNLTNGAVPEG